MPKAADACSVTVEPAGAVPGPLTVAVNCGVAVGTSCKESIVKKGSEPPSSTRFNESCPLFTATTNVVWSCRPAAVFSPDASSWPWAKIESSS